MSDLLLLFAGAGGLAAQAVIDLSPVPSVELRGGTRFEFSLQGERNSIWGGGPAIPRKFFRGDLPALFSRTFALEGDVPAVDGGTGASACPLG